MLQMGQPRHQNGQSLKPSWTGLHRVKKQITSSSSSPSEPALKLTGALGSELPSSLRRSTRACWKSSQHYVPPHAARKSLSVHSISHPLARCSHAAAKGSATEPALEPGPTGSATEPVLELGHGV
ncbi:unnamed protein product [Prorocentrum cordatum]|uniref:Uncharacterized protein n=1 Tax=Prorocentrum cordatum TaxID=2364126 RepID=A0ABN9UZD3_9DINO|nr:unnamed protein product [Polarella glacialis]